MAPEVANLGIMRPPFIYLGAIVLGLLLHFAWPMRLMSPAVSGPLGGMVVLVAVVLFLWAVRRFRTAGTPVPGNRPTIAIVRTGPYRYSRNPNYVMLRAKPKHPFDKLRTLLRMYPGAVASCNFFVGSPTKVKVAGEKVILFISPVVAPILPINLGF